MSVLAWVFAEASGTFQVFKIFQNYLFVVFWGFLYRFEDIWVRNTQIQIYELMYLWDLGHIIQTVQAAVLNS